jgi:rhodanese-related sulfurtransferase
MKFKSLLTIILAFLFLSACQSGNDVSFSPNTTTIGKQVQTDGGSYIDLTVNELNSLLDKKDFLLVNVHTPFEGNLSKTDLSIPYDEIGQNLNKLPEDKNAKIVLFCRSGHMSGIAAKELVKLGYTNISELAGGMLAWEQAGLKVEK